MVPGATPPKLSAGALIARLQALQTQPRAAIAFDGDGTLWSGDVAVDVFERTVAARRILPQAHGELRSVAQRHGLSPAGTPTELAWAIFGAYQAGSFPEREVVDVMAWCYAGWTVRELRMFARDVLAESGLPQRLNQTLAPILEFARSRGLICVVVSASAQPIVEAAAALWGFSAKDVAAVRPAVVQGKIAPAVEAPVPYAEGKVLAGRRLIGDAQWLASFGDNVFDEQMLREACLGVAVRPKPALRALLPALPQTVLLADPEELD